MGSIHIGSDLPVVRYCHKVPLNCKILDVEVEYMSEPLGAFGVVAPMLIAALPGTTTPPNFIPG